MSMSEQRVDPTTLNGNPDRVIDAALQALVSARPELAPRAEQLRMAAEVDRDRGLGPLRSLLASGVGLAEIEHAAWAAQGFDYFPELPEVVSADLLDRLPPHEAVEIGAFPIGRHGPTVLVAVVDPRDPVVLRELATRFADEAVELVITTSQALEAAAEAHEDSWSADDLADEEAIERTNQLRAVQAELVATDRIAELADVLVEQAVVGGASDIHIEPELDRCLVRFRLDGILRTVADHPASYTQILVNRIKIIAQLDVGDRRTPQDGRATAIYGTRTVDLRVVTIPSAWGPESCVVRLLDQSRARARLTTLGLSRHSVARIERLLTMQGGVVMVTGPTGSGKTTTLYSALSQLTSPEVKTVTVEDPVEYRLPGMLQVQVNRTAGFDFPSALRAILRADPDVLLVGEVRDPETARTAMTAALTGQVVLASLHTATAAASPVRLTDLGIERYMVAAALRGVVNQRLVRRLCRRCRTPFAPRRAQLDAAGWPFPRPERLWAPNPGGCDACWGTGYRGRSAVAEVLIMDDVLANALADGADPTEIDELALRRGMRPIRHDALYLARQGITSLAEVDRVMGIY